MLESLDFTSLIQAILELVIALASTFITAYLIPFIKSKLTEKQLEYVKQMTEICVKAAEQLYDAGEGAQKKEYCIEQLQLILDQRNIKIDITTLESFIESKVLELNLETLWDIDEDEEPVVDGYFVDDKPEALG